MSDAAANRELLKLRQFIADIDLKLADAARVWQEFTFAPWQIVTTALGNGTGLFVAGAAFMKVFGGS